jgi:cysteine desulfurase
MARVSDPIYLDCNATTPICPEARDAVLAAMDSPGNASSAHIPGMRAADTVAHARGQVAYLLGTNDPSSIVFTSGDSP